MLLSQQLITLPQAKRLKELGVGQDSYFHYIGNDTDCPYTLYEDWRAREEVGSSWYDYRVSAFTVAELGVMLPAQCRVDHHECTLQQCRSGFNNEYYMSSYVTIHYHGSAAFKIQYARENEADSRAALLIHLLENNIITADEVNKRLNQTL